MEGLGEGAYCLTQLSSALEFARHAEASVLADITEDELNQVRLQEGFGQEMGKGFGNKGIQEYTHTYAGIPANQSTRLMIFHHLIV